MDVVSLLTNLRKQASLRLSLVLSESHVITEELTPALNSCNSTLKDLTPISPSSSSSHVVKDSQRRERSTILPLNNSSPLLLPTKLPVTFCQSLDQLQSKNSKLLVPLPSPTFTKLRELSVLPRDTRDVAIRRLPKKPKRRRPSEQSMVSVSNLGGLLGRHTPHASVTAAVPAA